MSVTEAIERLAGEPLRHVVALKMLTLYREHATLRFLQTVEGWVIATILPVHVSEYDRRSYPTADSLVLLDGSSQVPMFALLDELPSGEIVLKTSSDDVARHAVSQFCGQITKTFISLTLPKEVELDPVDGLLQGTTLSPEIVELFTEAGHARIELDECFRHGARWFATRRRGHLACACFVYQTFGTIWEVAGLFTRPDLRREGLAQSVVTGALRHLAAANLSVRYQVSADNVASLALARKLGLEEFLRVTHVWMHRR